MPGAGTFFLNCTLYSGTLAAFAIWIAMYLRSDRKRTIRGFRHP
jgi:hypothetical protein